MNDLPNDALEDLLHDFGAEGRDSVPRSIAARALKKDLCSTFCSTSTHNIYIYIYIYIYIFYLFNYIYIYVWDLSDVLLDRRYNTSTIAWRSAPPLALAPPP